MTATIDALARRIGELRAAEQGVFEVLGAWALDPESRTDERPVFAACSHRAAWRAAQLADRAPALASLPPDEAVAPGDDGLGTAVAALPTLAPDERMAGVERLGALLHAAYAEALAGVSPADGPSARLFARLAHDVTLPP